MLLHFSHVETRTTTHNLGTLTFTFFVTLSSIYTVSGKNGITLFLPLTLSNANWFWKFFHRQTYQQISSNKVIKYPTTPQTRCYTTLWNCCVQKSQWPGINCVNRIAMQDSAIQTICWKNIYPVTLASFLFTDNKTFIVAAPKNRQNDWQNAFAATKKKDIAIKRLRTLTFNHWWHQSASHKWLTVHQFNTCRSRSQD